MTQSAIDVLRHLALPAWRGIEFECGPWRFGFDQRHAIHAYPDRDGGYVEATGRNPSHFSFTAYFRNGISGKKERLYPDLWRQFAAACADRTMGTLRHPELGSIKAKCVRCETQCDPGRRDGVDVEVEFIETTDAEDELAKLLGQESPNAKAVAAARDLDAAVADVSPVPEYPEAMSPSALESLKALQGLATQFKLGVGNVIAGIDAYASAVDGLKETIEANDNPVDMKAILACQRLYDAVLGMAATVAAKMRPIVPAVVQAESEVDAVADFFGMTIDEFLGLNPKTAAMSSVPKGLPVFVYA